MKYLNRTSKFTYKDFVTDVGDNINGKVGVPILLYIMGVPGGIVLLLWFFMFRGKQVDTMSAKSAYPHVVQKHTLFSHKFIVVAGLLIAAMFFITVSYYPLIFSPETKAPAPPATVVK